MARELREITEHQMDTRHYEGTLGKLDKEFPQCPKRLMPDRMVQWCRQAGL